jgi:hypothetical protein
VRLIVVSQLGEATLTGDSLTANISRYDLKFTREGGLAFLWALETKRRKSGTAPFIVEAITIDGTVSLRFEYQHAAQLVAKIRAVYPKTETGW